MTTLQQNQPPILFWELYERYGVIRGQSVPHVPFYQAKKHFEIVYDLKGISAHYIIATNDASITRQDALEWAKAHHEGRVTRRVVDLSPCQPQIKK